MSPRKREKETKTEFGRRLEELAADRDMSMAEFARWLGEDPDRLYKYLDGSWPTLPFVRTLMEKADVNPIWLMTGKGCKSLAEQIGPEIEGLKKDHEQLKALVAEQEEGYEKTQLLEDVRPILERIEKYLKKHP